MHDNDRMVSRAHAAQLAGVQPITITRWANSGKLPHARTPGGHRRYSESAVKQLAADRRARKQAKARQR